MADDQWPPDDDRAASDEFLIAFGQITLLYNLLQTMMERIFEASAPLESDYAKLLFHRLNNRERIDLFSAFIRKNERDEKARDVMLECILHYDVCTENRNILMHVIADGLSEATGSPRFTKRPHKIQAAKLNFTYLLPISGLLQIRSRILRASPSGYSVLSAFATHLRRAGGLSRCHCPKNLRNHVS